MDKLERFAEYTVKDLLTLRKKIDDELVERLFENKMNLTENRASKTIDMLIKTRLLTEGKITKEELLGVLIGELVIDEDIPF